MKFFIAFFTLPLERKDPRPVILGTAVFLALSFSYFITSWLGALAVARFFSFAAVLGAYGIPMGLFMGGQIPSPDDASTGPEFRFVAGS